MPRLIETDTEERIDLPELLERLETERFDPRDEECFASWGSALKQLANNRDFLGDIIVTEMKEHCRNQVRGNDYNPQVILLSKNNTFLMRANFWPAMHDSVVVNSGTGPFYYGVTHDHNFSFLTVGYFGPGYWSEYYEYDFEDVIGHVDEPVNLRFVEKSKLDYGKVMLYRAHRDVHSQLPADEMSISLNIVETTHDVPFRDQYQFDAPNKSVHSIISVLSLEQMLPISAHIGGQEGTDLLAEFADHHPSDRVRFHALKARASALPAIDDRIALFEQAARQSNPYVSTMAKREAESIERGRAWIEGKLRSAA